MDNFRRQVTPENVPGIQVAVIGKRLVKRLVSVFLGMLGFFLFLHAVDADAMTKAVGSQPSAISYNGVLHDQLIAVSTRPVSLERNAKLTSTL